MKRSQLGASGNAGGPDASAHADGEESPDHGQRPGTSASAKVDGQIAGIQEQLRQLGEINDEMVEEHHAMARILSPGGAGVADAHRELPTE